MHEAMEQIRANKLAVDLELRRGRKLSIATIGEGVPYLAAAAQSLGHRACAVNFPDLQVEQAAAALGVENLTLEIRPRERLPLNRRFDRIVCLGLGRTAGEPNLRDGARIVSELVWWLNYRGRIVAAFDPAWAGGRWRLPSKWRRYTRPRPKIHLVDGRIEFSRRGEG